MIRITLLIGFVVLTIELRHTRTGHGTTAIDTAVDDATTDVYFAAVSHTASQVTHAIFIRIAVVYCTITVVVIYKSSDT